MELTAQKKRRRRRRKSNLKFDGNPPQPPSDKKNPRITFSHGTSVFAGVFNEEYLRELRGRKAAAVYDEMMRSDEAVDMIVTAVTNPIRKGRIQVLPWTQEEKDPFYDQAQRERDFVEFQLFNDMDKPWDETWDEILDYLPMGHSVHVMVDKNVRGHYEWGNYSGLHSLNWISQKTIERWNLHRETGQLLSITQHAEGDQMFFGTIPAEFLVVFSLRKRGNNYEGRALLRSAYGAWWRKQQYLKLQGIGMERSLGIPMVKVPDGFQNDEERDRVEDMLEALWAHEAQYVLLAEGWEFETINIDFKSADFSTAIQMCDEKIVRAGLGNLFNLGQGGKGGAYALGRTLEDVFYNAIECWANYPINILNQRVLRRLVNMQFGPHRPGYPFLQISHLSDQASVEFSAMMANLKNSGLMKNWTNSDEVHLRDFIGWIEQNEEEIEEQERNKPVPPPAPPAPPNAPSGSPAGDGDGGAPPSQESATDPANQNEGPTQQSGGGEGIQMAAQRSDDRNPAKLIEKGGEAIKDVMRSNLRFIADKLIADVVSRWEELPQGRKAAATKGLKAKGGSKYGQALQNSFVNLGNRALDGVIAENPAIDTRKFSMKLADDLGINKKAKKREMKRLPKRVQSNIRSQADLVAQTQIGDLEKAIFFSFQTLEQTGEDSARRIAQEMEEASESILNNSSPASVVAASKLVNATRHEFFFDPDVFAQFEAFKFRNFSPVTDICTDLNGRVFLKDDAKSLEYEPPLHHNCKSFLELITDPSEVDKARRTEKGLGLKPNPAFLKDVTLAERVRTLKSLNFSENLAKVLSEPWQLGPIDPITKRENLISLEFDYERFTVETAQEWAVDQKFLTEGQPPKPAGFKKGDTFFVLEIRPNGDKDEPATCKMELDDGVRANIIRD